MLRRRHLSALVPLPATPGDRREAFPVAGTVAGRAYASTTIVRSVNGEPGRCRLWLPLLDWTNAVVATCERCAHLVATLLVTKGAYPDELELRRRSRSKTIASELIWALTPPLVFATDDLVVAGMLEPAYDNGGDAIDYALNGDTLHLAIFDAMGHGLAAAGLATFALSAHRHSRRRGCDLPETYPAMDAAVAEQFPGDGSSPG